jgi:hypothetical protein
VCGRYYSLFDKQQVAEHFSGRPTRRDHHASSLSRVIHVNTPNSPLKLLKQKRSENDVEGIDVKIASAPPETSDLLLTYRETAISLRAAIDFWIQKTLAIAT